MGIMNALIQNRFRPAAADRRGVVDPYAAGEAHARPAGIRDEGAWRVFPLEGAFEFSYHDVSGRPSLRRVIARELKVGPGKTLLGAIDIATDSYRGFRGDRIRVIEDADTGEVVDHNIIDWLLARALRQEKARRRHEAALARAGVAPETAE